MCNHYLLTTYKVIGAKIAHFAYEICAFIKLNVTNPASRGPDPFTAHGIMVLYRYQ